ncbi:MAG TPA: carboxypeptidase-like regulatory domain-containing protein, partial [Myxococcota bacterium]|nr:carboxypeptidase-like regulatory domain-containing protein [Myxococcota bacterium]
MRRAVHPALCAAALAAGVLPPPAAAVTGRVLDAGTGAPVAGAMVTASRAQSAGDAEADPDGAPPRHAITVFSAEAGDFSLPLPAGEAPLAVRARRIGWADARREDVDPRRPLALRLARERDPAALAAQLPANRWWALVLERLEDEAQREELVRQCAYCHQQGHEPTRRSRPPEEWVALLDRMGRMGGIVSPALRARIPATF